MTFTRPTVEAIAATLQAAGHQPRGLGPSGVERGIPLYEQIQTALWERILAGDIGPGEHLGDRFWADELKVSRTPVREAMRQMARDGVLVTLDNGGYRLRPVDRQGLVKLYVCRSVLAAAATREATHRGTAKLFRTIKTLIDRNAAALEKQDAETVLLNSSKFHRAIIDASNNEYLINFMATLSRMILYYRVTLFRKAQDIAEIRQAYLEHLVVANRRHAVIVEAMTAREADRAAWLMEAHLRTTAMDMDLIFSRASDP